ncbi:hypothetical protein [Vibrio sp. 10N.222.55.B11]|uniref:hypothetical protein n=1 Tax=Vibrio sp. 10N.222.55.B11 TaxID=3229648 RepID=UPI00354D3E28
MAEYQTIIVAVVTALSSGVGVGITLKTDIDWIKKVQHDQEQRIRKLEDSHD